MHRRVGQPSITLCALRSMRCSSGLVCAGTRPVIPDIASGVQASDWTCIAAGRQPEWLACRERKNRKQIVARHLLTPVPALVQRYNNHAGIVSGSYEVQAERGRTGRGPCVLYSCPLGSHSRFSMWGAARLNQSRPSLRARRSNLAEAQSLEDMSSRPVIGSLVKEECLILGAPLVHQDRCLPARVASSPLYCRCVSPVQGTVPGEPGSGEHRQRLPS